MVEENAIAGIDSIGFAIIDRDPIGVELGDCVGTPGVEGRALLLGYFLDEAVEFAGACLIETGFPLHAKDADRFENAQGAYSVGISSVFRSFEANRNVTHGGEVVDFVGLDLLDDADEIGAIGKVAVVQDEVLVLDMGILVQVIDAVSIKEGGTAFDAVDDIPFLEEKLGKVSAILAGNAGN